MLSLKSSFSFIISPCFSPGSLRPTPLLFSQLYYLVLALFCPLYSCHLICLSSFLFSVPSFPLAFPHLTYSHSPQLKDPILLELHCLCVLKQLFSNPHPALPFFICLTSVTPPSKQCMTLVAIAIFSCPQGGLATSEGGETQAPFSSPP